MQEEGGTGGGWAEVLRRGHTQDGVDTDRDRDMLGGGRGVGTTVREPGMKCQNPGPGWS